MNQEQFNRISNDKGFIAALDQSGGSTPKALRDYGVTEDQYSSEEEMYALVHEMRTRIIKSPSFTSEKILGAILFENTMDRKIDNKYTADYLADQNIVPFLKIDKGLAEQKDGVQLMKPIEDLDNVLRRAISRNIFGTKMRSNILEYNEGGIAKVVKQQFDFAKQIIQLGLVPIVEPEVNIYAKDKDKIEEKLRDEMIAELDKLNEDEFVILKLTIPTTPNLYKGLVEHPNVIRVVVLSGGYPIKDANNLLRENDELIASFSRALVEDLNADQSTQDFDAHLKEAVDSIYDASVNKN